MKFELLLVSRFNKPEVPPEVLKTTIKWTSTLFKASEMKTCYHEISTEEILAEQLYKARPLAPRCRIAAHLY